MSLPSALTTTDPKIRALNTIATDCDSQQAHIATCPRCGSEALNKYGHLPSGKQRYLCLVCDRQFVWPPAHKPIRNRPLCPVCGNAMHIYVRETNVVRFRCAHYPECRGYAVIGV